MRTPPIPLPRRPAPTEGSLRRPGGTGRGEDRQGERLTKAEAKAETRPLPTTPTENADEKLRAQPLGLNGDTVAKKKKPKHHKGEVKERYEEKPKEPAETPNTVAPTVNPNLAAPVPPPPTNSNPTQP